MTGPRAAAGELTGLVARLGRTRSALDRLSRLPQHDFDGRSGDAFRSRASRSADDVAGLASDVALLAGALAALGREPDGVTDGGERGAQGAWQDAILRYEEGRPAVVDGG